MLNVEGLQSAIRHNVSIAGNGLGWTRRDAFDGVYQCLKPARVFHALAQVHPHATAQEWRKHRCRVEGLLEAGQEHREQAETTFLRGSILSQIELLARPAANTV